MSRLQGSGQDASVCVRVVAAVNQELLTGLLEMQLHAALPVLAVWFVGSFTCLLPLNQRSAEQKPRCDVVIFSKPTGLDWRVSKL